MELNFELVKKIITLYISVSRNVDLEGESRQMILFKISTKQAQDFARAIFTGIDAYVEVHREEYEEFLRLEEETKNGEDDKQ